MMSSLTPIEALCAELHAGGFVLTADSRTSLSLKRRGAGSAGVSDALAKSIRYHKRALIAFLIDREPCAPHPCRNCGGEFVSTPDQACKWCLTVIGRPLRMKPNSPEERAFLRAYEARESARQTLPTVPAGENRPIWDSSSKTLPAYATTT